jgi:hypothetical protein
LITQVWYEVIVQPFNAVWEAIYQIVRRHVLAVIIAEVVCLLLLAGLAGSWLAWFLLWAMALAWAIDTLLPKPKLPPH